MYYQCRNNSRGGFLIPLVGGILIGGLISPYFTIQTIIIHLHIKQVILLILTLMGFITIN